MDSYIPTLRSPVIVSGNRIADDVGSGLVTLSLLFHARERIGLKCKLINNKVIITDIEPNSVAYDTGIRLGWQIWSINSKQITTSAEVLSSIEQAQLAHGPLVRTLFLCCVIPLSSCCGSLHHLERDLLLDAEESYNKKKQIEINRHQRRV